MKIIFLDIDGVLNGYNKWTYLIIDVSRFFHIPVNVMRKYLKVFGVRKRYVKRLSKIIKKTNAKVVMSSSWRGAFWNLPYENKSDNQKRLVDLLNQYKIEVIDITPRLNDKREDEINWWLNNNNFGDINSFVILDDESFDLQSFVGKQLVKTSSVKEGSMIQGLSYEDTGLKRKHVKRAIRILNGELV